MASHITFPKGAFCKAFYPVHFGPVFFPPVPLWYSLLFTWFHLHCPLSFSGYLCQPSSWLLHIGCGMLPEGVLGGLIISLHIHFSFPAFNYTHIPFLPIPQMQCALSHILALANPVPVSWGGLLLQNALILCDRFSFIVIDCLEHVGQMLSPSLCNYTCLSSSQAALWVSWVPFIPRVLSIGPGT